MLQKQTTAATGLNDKALHQLCITLIEGEKKEVTPPPQTLRIVNTISGMSEISRMLLSTTVAHVWRMNSIVRIMKLQILSMSILCPSLATKLQA